MPPRRTTSAWPGPEALAFLAAVCEQRDDAPRLVFADWLEEHGRPERGRFIRAQCELARLPPEALGRTELEKQAAGLLWGGYREWLLEVASWARNYPPPENKFRRGFVAVVAASAGQWLRGERALRRATPIEELRVRDLSGLEIEFCSSPSLAGLSALTMWVLGQAGGLALARSPHLEGLSRLCLEDRRLGPDVAGALAGSTHLSALTELGLSGCAIGNQGAVALAASPVLANLRVLSLADNGVGPVGAGALAASAHLGRLTELDLGNKPDGAHAFLGDAGVAALAASPNLANLTVLRLSNQSVAVAGARALASSPYLARLRELDLTNNHVGAEGAEALAGSANLTGLIDLSLANNRIGDDGARALAGSRHLAGLEVLNLWSNGLTGAGARALLEAPHFARLASLEVGHNSLASELVLALARRYRRAEDET
jgi:uncharacterized protein (TIGR02996 family)